jgi:hypothetical protein
MRRAQLPQLGVVHGGEQLTPPSIQQRAARAGVLGQRAARHRQKRAHPPQGAIEPDAQPLGQGDPGAQPSKGPWPNPNGQAVQARLWPTGFGQELLEQRQQALGM